jgi:hypothetical protein
MLKRRLTLTVIVKGRHAEFASEVGDRGKSDGKKKSVGKERRSKDWRFAEKVETCSILNPANFPSHHRVLSARKMQDTLEIGRTNPHEKLPLFLDINSLVNEIANFTSNSTQRKICTLSIE